MKLICSNECPEHILHAIYHAKDFDKMPHDRLDISNDEEYMQVAALRLKNHKKFRPHKHIDNERKILLTQESWVVIKGKVVAFYYDIDDSLICEETLEAGSCSITYCGGHTYQILEDNTFVYEFKNGPYLGVGNDKEFIID